MTLGEMRNVAAVDQFMARTKARQSDRVIKFVLNRHVLPHVLGTLERDLCAPVRQLRIAGRHRIQAIWAIISREFDTEAFL
jgi:hypothetical protein